MLQEKGSSGAFSNIYLWIAVIFFFNFKLLSNDDQSNESENYVKNNF